MTKYATNKEIVHIFASQLTGKLNATILDIIFMNYSFSRILFLCLLGSATQVGEVKARTLYSSDSNPIVESADLVGTDVNLIDSRTKRFALFYRVNSAEVDTTYMTNRFLLDSLTHYLKESSRIDSIVIHSYSSPEGTYQLNKALSERRNRAARDFILGCDGSENKLSSEIIKFNLSAENWAGLREAIVSSYKNSDKEQILAIIDSDLSEDEKKSRIRHLSFQSWKYIVDNIMPALRYSEWVCTLKPCANQQSTDISDYVLYPQIDEDIVKTDFELEKSGKARKTIIALKTNMLYDAVTWLNYGIEVPFVGNKFSVNMEHQFPWWGGGEYKNKFSMRYLQVSGEFRWWFAPRYSPATKHKIVRDCLTGHFLGAYGMGGKWDFQNKRKICYQGEFWSAGLTYGYSFPIARRLNLEFSASVGYASIPHRHYIPSEDYSQLFLDPSKSGTWNYWGITKLGVSLVVPITINKTNSAKKGGLR